MSWAAGGSKIFQRYLTNMINNDLAFDYLADTIKVALYNDTITPDNDVTTDVLASYDGAASQWVTAGEVIDTSGGTDWPAGGPTAGLAGKAVSVATADVVTVDANDLASGATADIASAFGCLVYDNTLTPKHGLCYNYFGGGNQVTNGTFTIVWSPNGIFRFTL